MEGFLINWCLALTTEQESEGEEKQKVLIALFFFLTLSVNIDCFQDCLLALLLRRMSTQNFKIVVSNKNANTFSHKYSMTFFVVFFYDHI